jgi:hypothetical protein
MIQNSECSHLFLSVFECKILIFCLGILRNDFLGLPFTFSLLVCTKHLCTDSIKPKRKLMLAFFTEAYQRNSVFVYVGQHYQSLYTIFLSDEIHFRTKSVCHKGTLCNL